MTGYAALSCVFLLVAAAVCAALSWRARPRPDAIAMSLTALVLVALTAVFDNLMIAAGLFHYSSAHLLGIAVGLAPLEDFAYPVAGALLLPPLWELLRSRRSAREEEDRG